MIDVLSEQIFSLRDMPASLKRILGGRKVHRATGYRWVLKGLRGVRLETIKVGGARYTSNEAVQRFVERLTKAADQGDAGIVVVPDSTQQTRNTATPTLRSRTQVSRRIDQILNGTRAGASTRRHGMAQSQDPAVQP